MFLVKFKIKLEVSAYVFHGYGSMLRIMIKLEVNIWR
jgi:hypothetical protein